MRPFAAYLLARIPDTEASSVATLMTEAVVHELIARQNGDGGWGAVRGAVSNSEITALACLALANQPAAAVPRELGTGVSWLRERQHESGAWSYGDVGPHAVWPTPIVLMALAAEPDAAWSRDAGYDFLLGLRGESMPWRQRFRQFLSGRQVIELDSTLDGWPWAPGTFAWVEPTAWALLALKSNWPGAVPRAVRRRIRDGEKMLADRACVGGGWNYGNKRVYDEDLPPYPDTTALALLGLRGSGDVVVESGFSALDALLDEHASGLSLALAALARRAWRRDAAGLLHRLAQRYDEGSFKDDHRTLALAALSAAPRLDWLGGLTHA